MDQVSVLGIPVDRQLISRWVEFYAPSRQPVDVSVLETDDRRRLPPTPALPVTPEWRDTFFLYRVRDLAWLSENDWRGLPRRVRHRLTADRAGRMRPKPTPCWPSDPLLIPRLLRWVEAGVRPSLHPLARDALTSASHGPLPRAAELAGRFPHGSGPNCFGTVMAAAGRLVERDWVQQDQFEQWLSGETHADPAGSDDEAGQVLLWHEHGQLAHAAVTLGQGWALHKPSQSWSSPTLVWTVDEVIRAWRLPGTRLTRRRIR